MRAHGAVLAVLGLVAAGSALYAAREALVEGRTVPAEAALPAPVDVPHPPPAARPAAASQPVRPVAPEVVALPHVRLDELQRAEPRAALSAFARPLPRPLPRNRGRLYRPFIDAAGQVAASGVVVTLAGIVVTPAGKVCTDAEGRDWPCGLHARGAFRSFVRGRALACDLPPELAETTYTATCTLAGRDAGLWLVEQGWVLPAPGGPYAQAGAAARAALRGIHGAAPEAPAEPSAAALADGGVDPVMQP